METSKTLSETARELIGILKAIPGQKIVTLTCYDGDFTVDIDAEGNFGYRPQHKSILIAKLRTALLNGGGLIVRQFLNVKVERKNPQGEMIWIPKKKVYGFYLGASQWKPVPAAELRESYSVDAITGKALTPESDIIFSNI